MPQSEFSSNIEQIVREIKDYDKKTRYAIRKAMRVTILEAARADVDAVKNAASFSRGEASGTGQPREAIPQATSMKAMISVRMSGAKITVDSRKAPQANALEGSSGKSGGRNRHPVFGNKSKSRSEWTWVNQPTLPYFYRTIARREQVTEAELYAQVLIAIREAGWRG